MGRQPRRISENGLYHLMFRGINRQNIFDEVSDYSFFLDMLDKIKSALGFDIYAYCLMTNHGHLLIKESCPGDLISIMQRLLTRYAHYYNKKYERCGTLFGQRYASEVVSSDRYLWTLVRYIHQNPVRAGFVDDVKGYRWSSYQDYCRENSYANSLVNREYLFRIIAGDWDTARSLFIKLHEEQIKDDFDPRDGSKSTNDEKVRRAIIKMLDGNMPHTIGMMSRVERNRCLSRLRSEGYSIRQLERVTGVSRGIIARAAT